MALLTVQFGMQPMLTKKFTPPGICKSSFVMLQEMIKFSLAVFMLCISGGLNRNGALEGWSFASWLKVAAFPAFLYSIQNIAALKAYQNLDGVTFVVLNQTKTLSAALCCYLLMGRKQSLMQIVSLFLLLASALVIEDIIAIDNIIEQLLSSVDILFHHNEQIIDGATNFAKGQMLDKEERVGRNTETFGLNHHLIHGVMPVLLASFISGLAGAISQRNLQSDGGKGRNSYLFSAELCVASIIILSFSLLTTNDGQMIYKNGFFNQWTYQTLIPIISNSIGGILVGLVTKHAGSVRKGFALIFGMLFTGLIQSWVPVEEESDGDNRANNKMMVSREQIIGGVLAAVSLWIHATNPHVEKRGKELKQD